MSDVSRQAALDIYDLCRIRIAFGSERDLPIEIASELEKFRAKTIEECARIAEQFAEVTGKLDGGMKSTTAAGMWNIAKAIRALDSKSEASP